MLLAGEVSVFQSVARSLASRCGPEVGLVDQRVGVESHCGEGKG